MMLTEAIILAGGLGTRLRSVVEDKPKALAPVAGRPFLEYLLDHLIAHGIRRCVFSVGYKSSHIMKQFGQRYRDCEIVYATEAEPLGTGGAILNAMREVESENVLVTNGDSLFLTDLQAQFATHLKQAADVTLALKPMRDFSRYGTVTTDPSGRVTAFKEKEAVSEGAINGGVYIFRKASLTAIDFPQKFSVEREYFQAMVGQQNFRTILSDGYFLDIGIPADFRKAQEEFKQLQFAFPINVDNSWTLFLDRDGVINRRIVGDYVRNLEQFELLPTALATIARLSDVFGQIVVVTNQQGVGKGVMTAEAVAAIHHHLQLEVAAAGGRIDAVYYAPELKTERAINRKPAAGMALQAQSDFPEIDFSKSIMVGDAASDMAFGQKLGMRTAFVLTPEVSDRPAADIYLRELAELPAYLLR